MHAALKSMATIMHILLRPAIADLYLLHLLTLPILSNSA